MGVVDKELLQCKGSWEQDVAMLMAERVEVTERVTPVADMRNPAQTAGRGVLGCAEVNPFRRALFG
jgi:hypothetical protein